MTLNEISENCYLMSEAQPALKGIVKLAVMNVSFISENIEQNFSVFTSNITDCNKNCSLKQFTKRVARGTLTSVHTASRKGTQGFERSIRPERSGISIVTIHHEEIINSLLIYILNSVLHDMVQMKEESQAYK